MNSAITAAVILPMINRMSDRAIMPRSKVCPQCNGTRRDAKNGGKCQACQGVSKIVPMLKAA